MKKLSIKTKIMLWFTAALLVLVVGVCLINFSVSRQVLDQSIQERLVSTVNTNAQEIEFYNSSEETGEAQDYFISYKGGILKIDNDFCAYLEGISTALIDSENNLIYGSMPFIISNDEAFSFTAVGTTKDENGEKYYIYERKLSGESLDGLWLRGVVSAGESTHILYNMVRLSMWLIPMLAILILLGGYVITRRALLPIEKIQQAASDIAASGDLSKRIDLDIEGGKDEIRQLAQTINGMFDKLEASFDAERQFTSDASHELRTPIAVIKAHCEYAREFAQTPEEFRESLEVIERHTDRATELISQLLFFARLHNSNHQAVLVRTNLSEIVSSIVDDLTILLEGDEKLDADIEENIFVTADKSLISRLVNNLIDNAFKYSGSKAHVRIVLRREGQEAKLTVTDNGIGISPENIQKIWSRFYQEDPSRTETAENSFGLGLSMVQEIAHLHGGRMDVESVQGEGSSFTLTLPLHEEG